MAERTERSFGRKVIDKAFFGLSFITLPFGLYTAGTSLLAGEIGKAALAGTFAFGDITQIREHGRPPEKQSWYNPEKIMDRLIGSLRFNRSSTRMAMAAA